MIDIDIVGGFALSIRTVQQLAILWIPQKYLDDRFRSRAHRYVQYSVALLVRSRDLGFLV